MNGKSSLRVVSQRNEWEVGPPIGDHFRQSPQQCGCLCRGEGGFPAVSLPPLRSTGWLTWNGRVTGWRCQPAIRQDRSGVVFWETLKVMVADGDSKEADIADGDRLKNAAVAVDGVVEADALALQ